VSTGVNPEALRWRRWPSLDGERGVRQVKDGGGEGGVRPGEGVIVQEAGANPRRIGSTPRRLEAVAKFSMATEAYERLKTEEGREAYARARVVHYAGGRG